MEVDRRPQILESARVRVAHEELGALGRKHPREPGSDTPRTLESHPRAFPACQVQSAGRESEGSSRTRLDADRRRAVEVADSRLGFVHHEARLAPDPGAVRNRNPDVSSREESSAEDLEGAPHGLQCLFAD